MASKKKNRQADKDTGASAGIGNNPGSPGPVAEPSQSVEQPLSAGIHTPQTFRAIIDENGTFLYVNEAGAETLSRSAEDLKDKSLRDVLPKEIADPLFDAIKGVIDRKKSTITEQILSNDEKDKSNRLLIEPLRDTDETVHAVTVVSMEPYRQQDAEEQIRRSWENLGLFMNCTSDGVNISILDTETRKRRLIFCNERYVEMSGRSREELMGAQDVGELTKSHTSMETEKENRISTIKGLSSRGLGSWVRSDGKENYFEWTAAPVWSGKYIYFFGVDRVRAPGSGVSSCATTGTWRCPAARARSSRRRRISIGLQSLTSHNPRRPKIGSVY
jgi:PAS domain-containing protein